VCSSDLSQPEIAFLLPAPISRRQLLIHRLMRSQLGALFASVIASLVLPSASGYGRLRVAVAMWVFFLTARVYIAGVTLVRARLAARDRTIGVLAPIAIVVAAAAAVTIALAGPLVRHPAATVTGIAEQIAETVSSGSIGILLWPVRALVRPVLTPWGGQFVIALAGSLIVMIATTVWMTANHAGLDEVLGDAALQTTSESTVRRSSPRKRAVGWTLPLSGRTEGLFIWKNAMQMLRASNVRLLRWSVPLLIAVVGLGFAIMAANRFQGAAAAVCSLSLALTGFAVVFGPQIARIDLRGDLENLDLLKTWPVPSSAVIRGEMLWPAAFVTSLSWIGIVCAALFAGPAFPRLQTTWRLAAAIAAVIVAPAIVSGQYTVHNAVAVLFPAWVPLGNQRPRGVDAMGQRLILLAGVVLSLAVLALPGLLAGAAIWLGFRQILGAAVLLPAAVVFTTMMLIEVLLATEMLGPAYERLDVLSVERPE